MENVTLTWVDIAFLVSAAYLFFLALIMNTPNMKSAFFFKFVPFVIGAFLTLEAVL